MTDVMQARELHTVDEMDFGVTLGDCVVLASPLSCALHHRLFVHC